MVTQQPAGQSRTQDWYTTSKGELIGFVHFARTEGRFAKHFNKEGEPSAEPLKAQQDHLQNWHLLQELAGMRYLPLIGKVDLPPP